MDDAPQGGHEGGRGESPRVFSVEVKRDRYSPFVVRRERMTRLAADRMANDGCEKNGGTWAVVSTDRAVPFPARVEYRPTLRGIERVEVSWEAVDRRQRVADVAQRGVDA